MMISKRALLRLIPFFLLLAGLTLSGCKGAAPTATSTAEAPGETASPSAPAAEPTVTVTALPAAARVNGEAVLLSEYEAELERFRAAQPEGESAPTGEEQSQAVLDALVDQVLLAQGAVEAGYAAGDAEIDARIQALAGQMGGEDVLLNWQQSNGYTPESFREALRRQAASAWQRDQIAASVPETAEQVHARQILLLDESLAGKVYDRLQDGVEFATLARQYDAVTGGELGWFPAGFLTQPEVEEAVFNLQPGQYSEVIESALGYHILQVIERDPQHPLSPEARRAMQQKALRDWLEQRRAGSQIEILLN